MRKALLSLFVLCLSFFGFSNASSVTTSCDSRSCSVCDSVVSDVFCCFNVPSNTSSVTIIGPSQGSYALSLNGRSWNYYDLPLTVENSSSLVPCVAFGMGSVGDFKLQYNPLPLLPGGQEALSGAVTNLTNSVSEFIPYIVYIGIGLLVAVIGFVAIKRLINWVRAKIFSSFK